MVSGSHVCRLLVAHRPLANKRTTAIVGSTSPRQRYAAPRCGRRKYRAVPYWAKPATGLQKHYLGFGFHQVGDHDHDRHQEWGDVHQTGTLRRHGYASDTPGGQTFPSGEMRGDPLRYLVKVGLCAMVSRINRSASGKSGLHSKQAQDRTHTHTHSLFCFCSPLPRPTAAHEST